MDCKLKSGSDSFGSGMDIEKTLEERKSNYGPFHQQAQVAFKFKRLMDPFIEHLCPVQREALEMIAVKISRILTGNPNYLDNWHDIAGYATLVEKAIKDSTKHVLPL